MKLEIPWSRQPSPFQPESPRIRNPVYDADVTAFGKTLAVHLCTTGYILRADPDRFRFQLLTVDLQTGAERKLLLRVPYSGVVSGLEITHLRLAGPTLEIALAAEEWSGGLRFDLATADALRESNTDMSPREHARRRKRDILICPGPGEKGTRCS